MKINVPLALYLLYPFSFTRSSNSNRIEFCKEIYPESTHIANINVQFFSDNKLSWEPISKHIHQYLVIDQTYSLYGAYPKNPNYTSWYEICDHKMLQMIRKNGQLPNVILPVNPYDESFAKATQSSLIPFVSYCNRNHEYVDILFPKGNFEGCGRNPKIRRVSNITEWENKEDRVWFRGSLNRGAEKGRFTIINDTIRLVDLIFV